MIRFSRDMARQMLAALRGADLYHRVGGVRPRVLLEASGRGLRLRVCSADLTIELARPGRHERARLSLPAELKRALELGPRIQAVRHPHPVR